MSHKIKDPLGLQDLEISDIKVYLGCDYCVVLVSALDIWYEASRFPPEIRKEIDKIGILIYKEIPYKNKQELAPYLLDESILIRRAAEKRLKQLDTTVKQ